MNKLLLIFFYLACSIAAFSQQTDAQLTTQVNVIRNETVPGANTKERVANTLQAIVDNKVNVNDLTNVPSISGTEKIPVSGTGKNSITPNLLKTFIGKEYGVALSDLTTALTIGTNKAYFRVPKAFTVTGVRASLLTAQASGSVITIDINENGTSILSTKLTIDNTEKTSTTAATSAVISDTALADDAEITFDIDVVGTGGAGLIVWIIGY